MESQPPRDQSTLIQIIQRLSAMQAELAAITDLLLEASTDSELTPAQYKSYIMNVKHNLVSIIRDPSDPMPTTHQIPLRQPRPALLKPGKRPQIKYKHHCKVCDGEWIGDEPTPPTCNYCRSTIWQTGETKWAIRRKNQEAGEAFA